MSNSFPMQCANCHHKPPNDNTPILTNRSYLCIKCHKVTYLCDGTCITYSTRHLSYFKKQKIISGYMWRKLQKQRVQYHTSSLKLHNHILLFHRSNDEINPLNVSTDILFPSSLINHDTSISLPDSTIPDMEITNESISTELCTPGNPQIHLDSNGVEACEKSISVISQNKSMNRYVTTCLEVGVIQATKILVCNATFQKVAYSNRIDYIPMENIALFLNMAKMILLTGNEGQATLVTIMQLIWKYFPTGDMGWLPIPFTTNMIQAHIINPSNQFSLISMLPIPHFHNKNLDHHAIITMKEQLGYIVFFTGTNSHLNVKKTHQAMIECPHVQKFLEEIKPIIKPHNVNVLCMTLFWLDGYDPNTSSKGNRKGAWAGSRTFLLYDLKEQFVYLVSSTLFAVGPGKGSDSEDHTSIFQHMLSKNNELFDSSGQHKPLSLISTFHNRNWVDFYICHVGALMDNPERRSNFGLLQGNSRNHGVFGMSCYFDQLDKPFQACKLCYLKYVAYIVRQNFMLSPYGNACEQCYGYSLSRTVIEGKYKAPIVTFPDATDAPGHDLSLKPGWLTTELLNKAWKYTIERFVYRGDWDAGNVKDYMKLFCINEKTITGFIKSCRKYVNYLEYIKDPDDCDPDFVWDMSNNQGDANLFVLPDPPPMWKICPIDLCVETPMHLQMNFLHYNATFMFSWAKSISKGAQLIRDSQPHLMNAKQTNLEGFKVIPIRTEKFGGYVAENWRCLSLLSPWCFQFIENDSMKNSNIGPLPNPHEKPFASWRIPQLKSWFNIRHIELETLSTKQELVHMANQQWQMEISEGIVAPSCATPLPPSKIRELHNLSKNYCGSLMACNARSKIAEHRTVAYALNYLCVLNECYTSIHKKEDFSEHTTTYTLLGILRATTHFQKFVWIRCLYEGGEMGEGIIKTLRPLSPHGIKEGWAQNLLQSYYQQDVMNYLLKICNESEITQQLCCENIINPKKFVRYGTKVAISQTIKELSVLSVIFYTDNKTNSTIIGCMIAQLQMWYFCVIEITNLNRFYNDCNGYTYFPIKLGEMEYEIQDRKNKYVVLYDIKMWMTGLALPCYWKPGNENLYCFITDEGYSLNSSLEWSLLS